MICAGDSGESHGSARTCLTPPEIHHTSQSSVASRFVVHQHGRRAPTLADGRMDCRWRTPSKEGTSSPSPVVSTIGIVTRHRSDRRDSCCRDRAPLRFAATCDRDLPILERFVVNRQLLQPIGRSRSNDHCREPLQLGPSSFPSADRVRCPQAFGRQNVGGHRGRTERQPTGKALLSPPVHHMVRRDVLKTLRYQGPIYQSSVARINNRTNVTAMDKQR